MAAHEHLNPKQMGRRKRRRTGYDCEDCGQDTDKINEYYMVHDSLWGAAGMETNEAFTQGLTNTYLPDGMLCVGCLENRIGRRLTPADFTDAPINSEDASDRLKNRQGRTEEDD